MYEERTRYQLVGLFLPDGSELVYNHASMHALSSVAGHLKHR